MQLLIPVKLLPTERVSRALGLVFLAGGVSLAAWAMKSVAEVDVDNPERLVIRGPYTYSRNPMYVAWDAIYVGIFLVANVAWPFLFLPAVLLWNHVQVMNEERTLARKFGIEYRDYKSRTRRYL